jgi:MscS family membrane protein
VAGFLILEYIWRLVNRYFQARLAKKGVTQDDLNLLGFLPALRLAFLAIFLWLAEFLFVIPPPIRLLLHAFEAILLAVAVILLLFSFVDLLDRLRLTLPDNIQQAVPTEMLAKVKRGLRIGILALVAIAFIYTQKGLFPPWLWEYALWRYLVIIVVLFVVFILGRFLIKSLSGMTSALKESQERLRLRLLLQATIWPLNLILVTIALYAIRAFFILPQTADNLMDKAIGILGTLAVILFIYRLLDVLEFELTKYAQREETPVDQTFVQMIRIFTRVVVIVVGSIYLLRAISGKPLSALLAGLGIGGLAIALASQDTLKNFFGSIMIMLDKPFQVGQRIVTGGLDGVVETIGFRSTRVRTLTGHLVTIPNEKIASSNIENIGRRPSIRRLTNITITYDTPPAKVEKALDLIREILQDHEGMHPDFPPRVNFNEFNDASLNIIMIYWYHPPNYWDFLAFNEKVNLRIMRAFEAEGIEFAFPSSTNYLAQDDKRPLHITLDNSSPPSDKDRT